MTDYVDIVFTGPPGPEAPRFVEVEDEWGRSIRYGEWVERYDGVWVLRIPSAGVVGHVRFPAGGQLKFPTFVGVG